MDGVHEVTLHGAGFRRPDPSKPASQGDLVLSFRVGMGQKITSKEPQVLVHVSSCQGSICEAKSRADVPKPGMPRACLVWSEAG